MKPFDYSKFSKVDLYETIGNPTISPSRVYYKLFNKLPSHFYFYERSTFGFYDDDLEDDVEFPKLFKENEKEVLGFFITEEGFNEIKKDFELLISELSNYSDDDTYLMVSNKNQLLLSVKKEKCEISFDSIFFSSLETYYEFVKKYSKFKTKKNVDEKNKLNLVTRTQTGFRLKSFNIKKLDIDLSLNYGKDFVDIDKKCKDFILNSDEDEKGRLLLLYGTPGTGKTTYIRNLIANNTTSREIIFFPPHMVESISDPGILPFLMDHKDSILVLEDAENVLTSRDDKYDSTSVTNLLQLTDGLLSDCLNIKVLATFNTMLDNIDEALLRKGRMYLKYEFNKLSKEDAQKKLDSLKIKHKANEEMSLADIYNLSENDFSKDSEDEERSIGFH